MKNETKSPNGRNKPKNNYAGDINKVSGYDVCQTPPHALDPLLPLLDKSAIIWESAAGPERLIVKTLTSAGFIVRGTDLSYNPDYNFFDFKLDESLFKYDIQVTNPPWSIKYEWIEQSFKNGKPFALLVPYETTASARFQNMAKQYHYNPWPIEVLAPARRINFKMPEAGWGMDKWNEKKQKLVRVGESAQMPTIWLTWGLKARRAYNVLFETFSVPMRSVKYNDDNSEKT